MISTFYYVRMTTVKGINKQMDGSNITVVVVTVCV